MKKLMAMLMIGLMLSLPIYSSFVFASITIHSVSVKGNSEVEGAIAPSNDQLKVEAVVSIDGDSDLTGNVRFGNLGDFNCDESETIPVKCVFNNPESGVKNWDLGIYPYTVMVSSDDGIDTKSHEGNYVVDGLAPFVEYIDIDQVRTSKEEVTLFYRVEDYAHQDGNTQACAGINKLEIYDMEDQNTPIATIIEEDTSLCKWDGQQKITLPAVEGTKELTLCAKAFDNLGQGLELEEGENCDTVIVDREGVTISEDSAMLASSDGFSITAFKDSSLNAVFSVNISGEDLYAESVKADLSALNLDKQDDYKEVLGECSPVDSEVFECKWAFKIRLSEAGTKEINVSAMDSIGNEVSKKISFSLAYDAEGPEVSSLGTGYSIGDVILARSTDTVFTAEIKEEGAGLKKEDVKLHISGISKEATLCEKKSGWKCIWNSTFSFQNVGTYEVWISGASKDRLGNSFVESSKLQLVVDNSITQVNSVTIIQEHGTIDTRDVISGTITTGDVLTIKVNLTEQNGILNAIGNFESISTEQSVESGSCSEPVNGIVTCTWSGILVNKPGSFTGRLKFTFTDKAGNPLVNEQEVKIFENANADIGDYYNLEIKQQYLIEIDKEILGSLLTEYYREVVPIELKYKSGCNGDVEVLNARVVGTGDCSADKVFVNVIEGTGKNYNGFLEFLIAPSHADYNEIVIGTESAPCSLKYNVKCGSKVYTTPESEFISFKIPIRGDIQTATESVSDKIDSLKAQANNGEWLETLDDAFTVMNSLCKIKAVLSNVATAITLVGLIFGTCLDYPILRVLSFGACDAGEKTASFGYTTTTAASENLYKHVINKLCAFAQCSSFNEQGNPSAVGPQIFGGEPIMQFASGGYCDALKAYTSVWGLSSMVIGKYGKFFSGDSDESSETHPVLAGAIKGLGSTSTLELAKQSSIFSTLCMCWPGLIYNRKKARQIDCWYGYCLKYLVPTGLPVSQCNDQHAYQECVYKYGQWTVFLDLWAAPLKNLKNLFENPIASAWVVTKLTFASTCWSWVCAVGLGECETKWGTTCAAYSLMSVVESVAELSMIISTDGYFQWESPEIDYCELLLEDD